MGIMGLIAAGYAISVVLRLRSDEAAGRAEPVLAAAVRRVRWAARPLTVAAVGSRRCAGRRPGSGPGSPTGCAPGTPAPSCRGCSAPRSRSGQPCSWWPAVAVAVFGLLPGLSVAVGWAALAVAAVVMLLGPTLRLAQWIQDISPFTHVPKLPGGTVSAAPLAWLCVAALALRCRGPGRPAPPRHRLSVTAVDGARR